MFITKCDICGKEISNDKTATAGYGRLLSHYSFCDTCGKPIVAFLKKNKLMKDEEEKKKTTLSSKKIIRK
jgi:hypothetical protein